MNKRALATPLPLNDAEAINFALDILQPFEVGEFLREWRDGKDPSPWIVAACQDRGSANAPSKSKGRAKFTQLPFESEQINDPKTIRAIVEVGRGERQSAFSPPQFPGSYGAIVWGCGLHGQRIWGAGYARSDDTLRAAAVLDLLERYAPTRLIVYSKGLSAQLRHVSLSSGTKNDGSPFDGYKFLRPASDALSAGHWELKTFKKRSEPEGHHFAQGIAETALQIAEILQPFFSTFAVDHPHNHILATDLNPDPDGMVSRLRFPQ